VHWLPLLFCFWLLTADVAVMLTILVFVHHNSGLESWMTVVEPDFRNSGL